LEKASSLQEQWQQPAVLKQMIQRYYRFMQLKASHPHNTLLIPTLDIEIVWQTHLLRSEMYRNDCLRLFRRVIDHSLIMKNEMEQFFKEQAFLDTCQLYQQRFGDDYFSLPSSQWKNKVVPKFLYDDYGSMDDEKLVTYSYWDKTHYTFSENLPRDYENPSSFTEGDLIFDGKWLELCEEFMSKAFDKMSTQINFFRKPSGIDLRSEA
jgi:hypothetical protein